MRLDMKEWAELWFAFIRKHNDGSEVLMEKSKLLADYHVLQKAWVDGYMRGKRL